MGTFLTKIIRDALGVECCLIPAGTIRGNRDYTGETDFTYAHLKAEIAIPDVGCSLAITALSGQCIADSIAFTREFARRTPPKESGSYLQADPGVLWDAETNTVTHIAGRPVEATRLYSVAITRPHLVDGMDKILPLITFRTTHPGFQLPAEDAAIPIKEVVVDYFSKKIWAELLTNHTFEEIDTDHDGFIERSELLSIATVRSVLPELQELSCVPRLLFVGFAVGDVRLCERAFRGQPVRHR
eukprot:m.345319 g.345319  ORF g.345319 m.345319 type:complete len:243 (-) comp55812_c0_seq15:181-909(-)